jgi:hypothetical protein
MSKYRTYQREAPPRQKDPHPIWRGIGCLIMLLVPVLSFGISTILVQMAPSLGIQLPVELLGRPLMPELMFKVPGLVGILNWIQSLNNIYAILVGMFIVAVILSGVLALVYSFVYRIVGPSRYTDLDAPVQNIKVKRYKR